MPEQGTIGVAVLPAFAAGFFLRLVVAAHARGRVLQSGFLRGGKALKRGFQLGLGQLQSGHAVGLQPIETRGVLEHRGVTAPLHIGQDVSHALLDGGVGVGRPMQTLLKLGFKIGLGGGQAKWAGGHGRWRGESAWS